MQASNLSSALSEHKDLLVTAEERLRQEQERRKEFQFKYEDAKGKVCIARLSRMYALAVVRHMDGSSNKVR